MTSGLWHRLRPQATIVAVTRQRRQWLEKAAGITTWLVVGGLTVLLTAQSNSFADQLPAVIGLLIVNLVAMLIAERCHSSPQRRHYVAFWIQLLAAFCIAALVPINFLPIFSIIWIAMAPAFYSVRVCFVFLVGLALAWFVLPALRWDFDEAVFNSALFATFHLFALLSANTANDAALERDRAQALNRELVGAQRLLGAASRQRERLRIARNLHDTLGHHLTALSLNLQIAERQSDGEVKQKVTDARRLTRLLLSDVRDAVSTMRDEDLIDLPAALRDIAENVPSLKMDIDVAADVRLADIDQAETVIRVVQEAITNTVRHAGASKVQIHISQIDGVLIGKVSDDGTLQPDYREGNGLTGMRERLQGYGGELELAQNSGGLALTFRLPLGLAV